MATEFERGVRRQPPGGEEADDGTATVFAGEGEMAARCRAFDWSTTRLGPVRGWSHALRTTVGIVLASRNPMLVFWGPELVQVYNDAFRPSLGEGGRERTALGARAREFWADAWPVIGGQIEQVMSGGGSVWYEDQLVPIERNGRLEDVWWTYSYSAVRDDDGAIAGTLVVCMETTARVLGERATRASERSAARAHEHLGRVITQAPVAMYIATGREHVFEVANAPWYALVGKRAEEVIGRRGREVFPELVAQGIFDIIERVYDSGEAFAAPAVPATMDADGDGVPEEHFFNLVYQPLRDDAGAVYAVALVATEVTELVRAQHAAEHARVEAESSGAQAEAVLESIADAFYLLDREWRFTYVNAAAEPLLQSTRAELLGRTLWEAFPVAGSPFEAPYREAMATGRPTAIEAYFDALATWFDVRTYPWSGGLMVHFRDIGARKMAEAERERLLADAQAARVEAEEANRAKGEFLAVMSHELRTPLNAIGGYAELMEMGIRGPVSREQRQDLARIQQSQKHLLGLINQVLNYTRIETGTVQYEVADVPVSEALAAAEALVVPQVRARGLSFLLDGCDPTLSARADREKLQQVLLNLLGNAIKFTEGGGEIRVACARRGDVVAVTVSDTGVGIAPDKLASVFEPFVQVDAKLTRTQEGVGLGLAISRDLARGMGGDLTAESAPGEGSRFTLTLPAA